MVNRKKRGWKHPISGIPLVPFVILAGISLVVVYFLDKKNKESKIARQVTPRDRFEYSNESKRYEYIHPY